MSENLTESIEFAGYLSYLSECAAISYRNCPVIDDIVQETMLAVLLEIRRNGTPEHPKAFLAAVLRHKYNDWLRKKYHMKYDTYADVSVVKGMSYEENFDASYEEEERAKEEENLRREIGRLMAIYREVIVRYYLRGHTVDRIAEELKIPHGTVMSRLHKGRERIREGMKKSMEKYTEASYAPKRMMFGLCGSPGVHSEPFSLVTSLIEVNILITAYEKPLSLPDIAGAMGIPCAYLEGFAEKLTDGELLGRTSGGLYYTRCFLQSKKDHFGDVEAQEAAARELAEPIWNEIWNALSGMMEEEEVRAMTDKQRATLLLHYIREIVSDCVDKIEGKSVQNLRYPADYPERPNGGRWYAYGTVIDDPDKRPKYLTSGPVVYGSRRKEYYVWDYQSPFGTAHFAYPDMKHSPDAGEVAHLCASLLPDSDVTPENERIYECIPELIKYHILRRDADGNAVPDIPALTFETAERWDARGKEAAERVFTIAGERLKKLYLSRINKIPQHVDGRQSFEHFGALGCYRIAQMLAIVEAGLLPYPVEIGKTPVIFLEYRKKEKEDEKEN